MLWVKGVRIMIKSIYSQNLESKNLVSKNKIGQKHVSEPMQVPTMAQSYSNYSLSNLKANYAPISFRGGGTDYSPKNTFNPIMIKASLMSNLPSDKTVLVSDLEDADLIHGSFQEKLINDFSVLLGTEKDVLMKKEEDVNPAIFIHSFTKKLMNNEYRGLGYDKTNTEVFYIHDIQAFNKRSALESKIKSMDETEMKQLNQDGKMRIAIDESSSEDPNAFLNRLVNIDESSNSRKIVFVNNFDVILERTSKFYGAKTAKEFFEKNFPNLSFVGLINKKSLLKPEGIDLYDQKKLAAYQNTLKHVENFSVPELPGLNTDEAKAFFQKNPEFINAVLGKAFDANLSISKQAIETLVDKSAISVKGNLPQSAMKTLEFIAIDKAKDLGGINNKGRVPVGRIEIKNVDDFFANHKVIADLIKPKTEGLQIVENVKTRFSDVGGLKQAKSEMEDILKFIKDPEDWFKKGKKIPNKLIIGSPGTGKTLLARALAGEAGVPFFYKNGSDFGTQYINSGAMAVNTLYEDVENVLRKTGKKVGIIFIDEADVIGAKRSEGGTNGSKEDAKVVNAWIAKLDGFNTKESDVKIITIAASNRPEVFDPALKDRPGRLGQQVNADVERTKSGRLEIINIHAKDKLFKSEADKVRLLDRLADLTRGVNGDNISQILGLATEAAEKNGKKYITEASLMDGYLDTIFGKKIELDMSPEELDMCRIHEAGHALQSVTLKHRDLIFISNEPRGKGLAVTYSLPKNSLSTNFETTIKDIVDFLGGGEGEKLLKGYHGSGVSDDYKRMTNLIENAIKKYNLGVHTPKLSFYDENGKEITTLVKQFEKEIAEDVKLFIDTSEKILEKNTEFHKDFLLNVYMKKCKDEVAAGRSGNFMGTDFIALREKWLKDTHKEAAAAKLEKWIDETIKNAANIKNTSKKIIKKAAKNIRK